MKIDLIKDENGFTIGYNLVAESVEDKLTLGTIRSLQFFGIDDTAMRYNGYTSEPAMENGRHIGDYAVKVGFIQEKHMNNPHYKPTRDEKASQS